MQRLFTLTSPAHHSEWSCGRPFPHVFLNRLKSMYTCVLRPTEHVRSTSQLLLLVIYQITAHDDSQKGTEKPTRPPSYTLVVNQMQNWSERKCVETRVFGGGQWSFSMLPPMFTKEWRRGGSETWSWGDKSLLHTKQGPVSGRKLKLPGAFWQEVVPETLWNTSYVH